MSRVSALSGKKANLQRSGRHKSGKSRAGTKAFAYQGPHGKRGVKSLKRQDLNFVTINTPLGRIKVTMKEYKTYFKEAWSVKQKAAKAVEEKK